MGKALPHPLKADDNFLMSFFIRDVSVLGYFRFLWLAVNYSLLFRFIAMRSAAR